MYYLDLTLAINAAMDAFLLTFTARLLRKKVHIPHILLAVLLGGVPVILIFYEYSMLTLISKILTPVIMVGISLRTRSIPDLAKGTLYFSLLAAVCGGIFYAFAGWLGISTVNLSKTLWILPLAALTLVSGYKVWEKSFKKNQHLDSVIFDVEVSFEGGKPLMVKALLDTGNDLRDPLTGIPVMILEEECARNVLPERIQKFLRLPWKESSNPWSFLWKSDDYYLQNIVFISVKGVNGQSWLPGIRKGKAKVFQGENEWIEQTVTVAIVEQVLSSENRFQALLHPEQIQNPVNKEEIAS